MLSQKTCPRKLRNCEPWANVVSEAGTFICCGDSDLESRSVKQDRFRLCFVSETTDTMYDHDENDMMDLVAVLSSAFALGCEFVGVGEKEDS